MNSLLAYAQENSAGSGGMSSLYWIIGAVGLWKMFEKAGEPGWIGLIPFYRQYKLCEKVMGDPWYWLRYLVVFIPFIGWIGAIYFAYQISRATAKSYGQDEVWALGYLFMAPVFYCITGFGNYNYYGVMGSGDTRTGEARQARTVEFDVVKNEPSEYDTVKANQVDEGVVINGVREASAEAESDVEFTFDGMDE